MIVKIPRLVREEYDELIREQFVSRVIFKGDRYPYVAPFLYVFDGQHIYFLSTNYGKKIEYFKDNPRVAVEIERYTENLSDYKFVVLFGMLSEVEDSEKRKEVRKMFLDLIRYKNLSPNVMKALGHSSDEPPDSIVREERNLVWKLVDVEDIMGFKSG
ncbi:MAG: pyridoxamine 5'-phosphate oxidase family protein [Archaeoglobaceae archaeon]